MVHAKQNSCSLSDFDNFFFMRRVPIYFSIQQHIDFQYYRHYLEKLKIPKCYTFVPFNVKEVAVNMACCTIKRHQDLAVARMVAKPLGENWICMHFFCSFVCHALNVTPITTGNIDFSENKNMGEYGNSNVR